MEGTAKHTKKVAYGNIEKGRKGKMVKEPAHLVFQFSLQLSGLRRISGIASNGRERRGKERRREETRRGRAVRKLKSKK